MRTTASTNGTNVELYTWDASYNNEWILESIPGAQKIVRIRPKNNVLLSVYAQTTGNDCQIKLGTYDHMNDRVSVWGDDLWEVRPVSDYTYYGVGENGLSSWWLGDSTGHLDWNAPSGTKYQAQFNFAIGKWNDYKANVIRNMTGVADVDVWVSDYTDTSPNAEVAYTDPHGSLCFNKHRMDAMSLAEQQSTCMHELGHALGLDESSSYGTVMYAYTSSGTTLNAREKALYDLSIWRW